MRDARTRARARAICLYMRESVRERLSHVQCVSVGMSARGTCGPRTSCPGVGPRVRGTSCPATPAVVMYCISGESRSSLLIEFIANSGASEPVRPKPHQYFV